MSDRQMMKGGGKLKAVNSESKRPKSSGGSKSSARVGAPGIKSGKSKGRGQQDLLAIFRSYANTLVKEEVKAAIPVFKGIDAPIDLGPAPLGFRYVPKLSDPLKNNLMTMFGGGKHYLFNLKSVFQLPASAAGYINGLVTNTSLQFNNDFVALTSVFSEFFVSSFRVMYQPNSRYNFLPNSVLTTHLSALPVGVANLQHGMPTYTSVAVAADNFGFTWHNSSDPFTTVWTNSEDINSTVLPEGVGTPLTQSWCSSTNVANYQGSLQYLSQTVGPSLPASVIVGHLFVSFIVAFRVRT